MTPGCTVCSYAIEWLRSCYSSKWRLFHGNPSILTPGRYVRAKPGAAHYPGLHNFGSRIWTKGDEAQDKPLGEVLDFKHVYSNGVPTAIYPPVGLIGSADCIRDGERWPLPVITRDFAGGWDTRCYDLPPPPDEDPFPPVTFTAMECRTQRQLAAVLEGLYTGNGQLGEDRLQELLPTATITRVPNTSSVIPGSLIAVVGDLTVVVIAGTTNPQQWTAQICAGTAGIQNQGMYSTLNYWQLCANIMVNRILNASGDPNGRLVLAGHSMGGAICCLLAARYRIHNRSRPIELLTFGCPKPGDVRLHALVSTVAQCHMVNTDDPITYLPPSGDELGWFQAIIPPTLYAMYTDWMRPTNRIGLRPDGTRVDNPSADSIYALLFRQVGRAVLGRPLEIFNAHTMSEYRRRIICPGDPSPSPDPGPDLVLWLYPESNQGYSDFDPILTWPDGSRHRNDATGGSLTSGPFAVTVGDGAAAIFNNASILSIPNLHLQGPLSAYMVGGAFAGPPFPLPSGPRIAKAVNQSLMEQTTAQFRSSDGSNSAAVALAGDGTHSHIWSVRRDATTIRIFYDGIQVGSGPVNNPANGFLNLFMVTGGTPAVGRNCVFTEVLVYSGDVGDEMDSEILSYLRGRWAQ